MDPNKPIMKPMFLPDRRHGLRAVQFLQPLD